jgi:uncharacterized protein YdeI (YjbR/CyaY-like superfamily)
MQQSSPKRRFQSKADWAEWLDKNHAKSSGIWLRLAKKDSGLISVAYKEALDVALCYGWIDGQKQPENDKTWLQRFVPRSARSVWSKINREKAEALIESGQMKPAGLAVIDNAKKNGRWHAAYDSQSKATVPPDFEAALDLSPRAKAFFARLESGNRYAILWRIQTAKRSETRARKIREFIAMLERNEKLHP